MRSFLRCAAVVFLCTFANSASAAEPYTIERIVAQTGPENYYWMQSRPAMLPTPAGPRVVIVSQEIEKAGSHGFHDLYAVESSDLGKTWSEAKRIESLTRRKLPGGDELVMGDVTPGWHAATKTMLATGKTFTFRGGSKEDRLAEQTSYAVFTPAANSSAASDSTAGTWSELGILALPEKDKSGAPILSPNSGCQQRVDLPNGDILLPVRYRRVAKDASDYTTIVARCKFDGKTLTYVEHGSELHHTNGKGFGEPSLVKFRNKFYLTIRNEAAGYVTAGDDGLAYPQPIQWTYDDGKQVPTYNTQQHWVANEGVGLYLVYTRRAEDNNHIFRHRAPLYIAQVDTEKLCLIRSTEQVLIPHDHADLGNFGVAVVSPTETWVVAAEGLQLGKRKNDRNKVIVAKIVWPAVAGPGSSKPAPQTEGPSKK
jgi:hypothetical protein